MDWPPEAGERGQGNLPSFGHCRVAGSEVSPQSPPARRHSVPQSKYVQDFAFLNPNIAQTPSSTTTMSVQTKATIASFGGKLLKLSHNASSTNCEMAFNLYLPPQTTTNPLRKVPLLIYLAGLTCTGDNGAEKGFFQHAASEKGIAVLYPDTSPRNAAQSSVPSDPKHLPNVIYQAV